MTKIPMGRSRKPDDKPYLTFVSPGDDGWTWRVLKAYARDDSKPFARWFCAVSSPMTHGGFDLGDTYVVDVVRYGILTDWDHEALGENLELLTVPVRKA